MTRIDLDTRHNDDSDRLGRAGVPQGCWSAPTSTGSRPAARAGRCGWAPCGAMRRRGSSTSPRVRAPPRARSHLARARTRTGGRAAAPGGWRQTKAARRAFRMQRGSPTAHAVARRRSPAPASGGRDRQAHRPAPRHPRGALTSPPPLPCDTRRAAPSSAARVSLPRSLADAAPGPAARARCPGAASR